MSGEYAALDAAVDRGRIDPQRGGLESFIDVARAGAATIATYVALEAARWLP